MLKQNAYKIVLCVTLILNGLLLLGGTIAYADEVAEKSLQQKLSSLEDAKEAVIKLFVVAHIVDTLKPWNSYISRTTGSGFIIEGDQILTTI